MLGLIANTGRGTVTGMLLGAESTRCWSRDRAHSLFARARWEPQTLGASLSHLVVRSLVPDGTPLTGFRCTSVTRDDEGTLHGGFHAMSDHFSGPRADFARSGGLPAARA